jgi:hypothetical protein
MSAYKDVEKRREYWREWARKKAIQNKSFAPKVESSPESLLSSIQQIEKNKGGTCFKRFFLLDVVFQEIE